MSQQAERRVGTVIANKWRVDALLGSGSMAAVYAVTHRNGARAALKILHPTLCTDQSVCERFLGEGYLTNRVKHVGIVRVLDDGMTDDGCVFLVMDLLEGKTLEELRQARGGQLELREALDIADKLMDALSAVHQAGIIHRDLKPQNVFICTDNSVKLLDFGVARVFDGGGKNQLSVFGMVLGTPSFMAPEQALGQRDKVDHRTDIWSLGATLFTAISGQTVHLGPNVQAKLLAAATVKARSIGLVRQDLPGPIAAAIDMALRFKQEERWQSVEPFRRALRESRLQLGLGEPPTAFVSAPRFDVDESGANLGISDERPAAMQGIMVPPAREGVEELDLSAGAKTEKMVKAGTFIGIGGPSSPPPLPAKARGNTSRRPPPPPIHGVAHTLGQPNLLAQVTDESAESYPAASSIDMDARERPRRSTFGVWLAAIALVLLAAGGVAFFAVNHANADPRQDAQATTTATTGATPTNTVPPAPAPTPSVIVIGDPPLAADGGAPPPPASPHSTTTTHAAHWAPPPPPPSSPHAIPRAPATLPTQAQAQSQPQTPPESTSVSPTPTTPAPDPFGTPE